MLSLFHRIAATPRPVQVGIALFFVAGLADGALLPFFALWAHRDLGVPTGWVGVLLGCYAGGELLATPLLGGIADRVGRRPTLLLSTLGIGAGFVLLPLASGPIPAALLLLAIGVAESVLHPTAAALLADVAAPGTLRRSYAHTRIASGAGQVVGPALGAALAAASLGAVFLGAGVAMLAAAALVATRLPETATPRATSDSHDDDDEESLGVLLLVFRDRRLAALLGPAAAIGLAAGWIEAVLPLYAAAAGTLSAVGIGWLFTWAGLVAVAAQLPVTRWTATRSGAAIVALGGVLLASAFVALLLSPALPALLLAVTLSASAGTLLGPLVQAVVAELAPASARSTYLAAFSVAHDLEDAAGPAIGTALFAAATALPWTLGAVLALGAALPLAAAARRHERATAPREDRVTP